MAADPFGITYSPQASYLPWGPIRPQFRVVGAGLVPALILGTHQGCPYDSSHGTRAPVSSMTSTGFSGLYLSKVHISGFFRI